MSEQGMSTRLWLSGALRLSHATLLQFDSRGSKSLGRWICIPRRCMSERAKN